jgi:hypothetical protein
MSTTFLTQNVSSCEFIKQRDLRETNSGVCGRKLCTTIHSTFRNRSTGRNQIETGTLYDGAREKPGFLALGFSTS